MNFLKKSQELIKSQNAASFVWVLCKNFVVKDDQWKIIKVKNLNFLKWLY